MTYKITASFKTDHFVHKMMLWQTSWQMLIILSDIPSVVENESAVSLAYTSKTNIRKPRPPKARGLSQQPEGTVSEKRSVAPASWWKWRLPLSTSSHSVTRFQPKIKLCPSNPASIGEGKLFLSKKSFLRLLLYEDQQKHCTAKPAASPTERVLNKQEKGYA